MPPSKKDREAEAVAAEDAAASKLSRALFDDAVDARMVSRVRPSSLKELVPSKTLKRSDCKDIHKRSSIKKSRYMTVFPGQLAHLREGRIGSLAKLDTQNPVMYIEYPGLGRLKLTGTIVRSRATRFLPQRQVQGPPAARGLVRLHDRLQQIRAWVGTADANPGEEPLPFPTQLKHVVAAAAAPSADDKPDVPTTPDVEFSFSVAADPTAKPKASVAVAGDDAPAAKRPRGSSRSPWTPTTSTPREPKTMVRTRVTRERAMTTRDAVNPPPSLGLVANRPRRRGTISTTISTTRRRRRKRRRSACFGDARRRRWRRSPRRCPRRNEEGARGRPRGRRGGGEEAEARGGGGHQRRRRRGRLGATRGGEIGGEEKAGGKAIQGGGGQTSLLGFLGRDGGGGGGGGGGSGEEAKKPAARQSAGVCGRRRRRRSLSSTATTAMRTRRWKRMTIAILRCERYRSDQCRRPSLAPPRAGLFSFSPSSQSNGRRSRRLADKGDVARSAICARSASSPPVLFLADRIGAAGPRKGVCVGARRGSIRRAGPVRTSTSRPMAAMSAAPLAFRAAHARVPPDPFAGPPRVGRALAPPRDPPPRFSRRRPARPPVSVPP